MLTDLQRSTTDLQRSVTGLGSKTAKSRRFFPNCIKTGHILLKTGQCCSKTGRTDGAKRAGAQVAISLTPGFKSLSETVAAGFQPAGQGGILPPIPCQTRGWKPRHWQPGWPPPLPGSSFQTGSWRGDGGGDQGRNRFSDLSAGKTAQAVGQDRAALNTPLKQGVNESPSPDAHFLTWALAGRVHLDTSPELAGIAERRSPIRRVFGQISVVAGSETGDPGEMSRCTLAGHALKNKLDK